MKCEIRGDKAAAKTILDLTAQWDSAAADCDAERMMENYLEDVEIYDVGSQVVGRENLKQLWRSCFPYFGESPAVYRRKARPLGQRQPGIFAFLLEGLWQQPA